MPIKSVSSGISSSARNPVGTGLTALEIIDGMDRIKKSCKSCYPVRKVLLQAAKFTWVLLCRQKILGELDKIIIAFLGSLLIVHLIAGTNLVKPPFYGRRIQGLGMDSEH